MEELLTTFNLEPLVPIFTDQKISIDNFLGLTEGELTNLIPDEHQVLLPELLNLRKDYTAIQNSEVTFATDGSSIETNLTSPAFSDAISDGHFEEVTSQDNDYLLDLLRGCNDGREVLQNFHINGSLKRDLLVKLLINKELEQDPNAEIKKHRFEFLTGEICKVFKAESPNTYFIPGYKDKRGVYVSAQGKLWNRYCNTRRKYIGLEIAQKRKINRKNLTLTHPIPEADVAPELEVIIEWLHSNSQPWRQVREYWKTSSPIRQIRFQNNCTEIHSYYEKFPALKYRLGYELIAIDFEISYPEKSEKLLNCWSSMHKSIIRLGMKKKCSIIANILKKYGGSSDDNVNATARNENIAILIFPLLFPAIYRKRKSEEIPRYSKTETQESFVTYIENTEDFSIILEERNKKFNTSGKKEQPAIILLGDLKNPQAFIKVNEILYQVSTGIEAVDYCFKSFFVLQAEFPDPTIQCWTFIQKKIFEIDTEQDRSFVCVSTLYSDIKKDQEKLLQEATSNN